MAQRHLKAVAKAAADLETARQKLVDAIIAAQESGETFRDIAPHAGLSYSRVYQMAQEELRRRDDET